MRRAPSVLVSYTPRVARRYLPLPEAEGSRSESHVVRRVPIRPGVRAVGLGRTPEKYDPRPEDPALRHAPLRPGFYLGVVEEVGTDETIHATLWETPNGRALLVELSLCRGEWGGVIPPTPGDRLKVHTWTELPEGDEHASVCEQMRVEVLREPLSDEELSSLDRAIETLERSLASDGAGGRD